MNANNNSCTAVQESLLLEYAILPPHCKKDTKYQVQLYLCLSGLTMEKLSVQFITSHNQPNSLTKLVLDQKHFTIFSNISWLPGCSVDAKKQPELLRWVLVAGCNAYIPKLSELVLLTCLFCSRHNT